MKRNEFLIIIICLSLLNVISVTIAHLPTVLGSVGSSLLVNGNIQNGSIQDKREEGYFSSAGIIEEELTNKEADYPPDCYYCDNVFDGLDKKEYLKHIVQKHPGKPAYPGPADIERYKLTPKGMWWENNKHH